MIRRSILAVLFLSTAVFSSPIDKSDHYPANELIVSVSLDSIKPGGITPTQLKSMKELVITSDGNTKRRDARTFDLVIMPHSGLSRFFKCYNNKLPQPLPDEMLAAKPNDIIFITNIVLVGFLKYKPPSSPMWHVVTDIK